MSMTTVHSKLISLVLVLLLDITTVTSFVDPLPRIRSCLGTEVPVVCHQHPGSGPYMEDFERLYHDQTAEYGIDLARQFQREQQVRIRRRQRLRMQQEQEQQSEQEELPGLNAKSSTTTNTPNSPGYFSTPGVSPRVVIVPTTASRRMISSNQNPWTSTIAKPTTTTSNQDNLFLIMSATVAAVAPSTTPVLLSVVAVVLSLSLSMSFILGDESPLATTTSLFPSQSTITEHSPQSTLFSQIHGL